MKNMTTYAEKYRDISYTEKPFNAVDGLILCQISYYDFELKQLENDGFRHRVSEFMDADTEGLMKYLLTINGDEDLIEVLRRGGRHGSLKVGNYIEKIDEECDQQFSAITFELADGDYFIAFRGTDNSVVGWKEDFNMSYQDAIPSQKEAVKYAIDVMSRYSGKFYLGGHSKGGNLAVYTAMMLPEELQNRLTCVYNYDGPGFLKEVYETEAYKRIRPLVRKIVPQTSIVGMLLEGDNNYAVIKSSSVGFMQHNGFTWNVEGDRFEVLEDVDAISNLLKRTLNRWVNELPMDERKQFVEIVFDIIYSMEISSLKEVEIDRKEKTRKLLKHLSNVEPEETKLILTTIGRFIQASAREMRQLRRSKGKSFRLQ